MNLMPSFIFSFNFKVTAFLAALLISGVLLEAYCRSSTRFNNDQFVYVRTVTAVDAPNAVFGDSHVGLTSMISGFAFLGQAGQQPKELLNLVHFLYNEKQPGKIIVEAAPQWVGEYHKGRPALLTMANLRPPVSVFGTPLLSLTPLYSGSLFRFLIADGASLLAFVSPSRAKQALLGNSVDQYAREWGQKRDAGGESFNWSQIEQEKRSTLTAARLHGQNPVRNFESSSLLRDYVAAIRFLKERGGEVCLFRTPVTADFLTMGEAMIEGRFSAFERWMAEFSRTERIRLVDFRHLSLDFDDSKFLNQDHLTAAQASKMWPLVAKACFNGRP